MDGSCPARLRPAWVDPPWSLPVGAAITCGAAMRPQFRQEFRQRPVITTAALVWIANYAAIVVIDLTRRHWATLAPDATHSWARHYRHSFTWYFSPALGRYLEYGFPALLVVGALLIVGELWLSRRERARARNTAGNSD
jgi:hypothetical protein